MSFVLIATTVVATAATVGVGVAGIVENKKQTNEMLNNQADTERAQAYIAYGTATLTGPGAIPM